MDTSNSQAGQSAKLSDKLTISRASFVLGRVRLKEEEVNPEDWVEIIDSMIFECLSQMKYLPFWKPLSEPLWSCEKRFNDNTFHWYKKKDEILAVKEGEVSNVPLVMRSVILCSFHTKGGKQEFSIYDSEYLILTDTGVLVTYSFDDKKFAWVSRERLVDIITQFPKVGFHTVNALRFLVQIAIERREEWLRPLREKFSHFSSIVQMVDVGENKVIYDRSGIGWDGSKD